ncbi:MAG TPA: DUF5777 family beta-barrel protein [Vicinamibacterales bacterium]|nr:DUF5777 family beta-barrel protein [Vicinamibacterales bacterium]
MTKTLLSVLVLATALAWSPIAEAADPKKPVPADSTKDDAAETSVATEDQADPDRDLNLAQPDFTVITLPTTLRVPRFRSAFRVTHRFTRPLGAGDFGDLVQDFFGLDSGAQVGLELRFGLMRGAQVGIHRTNDRTIQFFGQYDLMQQGGRRPLGLAARATIDGTNNFRDSYSPGLGIVVSRTIGEYAAIYAMPMWVNNTNPLPSELADDNDTVVLGLGTRVRVGGAVYLVAEITPRLSGFKPGVNQASFGVEKRVGGHVFQVNFSNGFGTTLAQVARGGTSNDDWYIGFNISRKFF